MKNNLYQEFIVPLKHSFRIMRNAFLALFLFVGATYATESYSQNMRVTVISAGISTGQVLNEIESQTDYLFVYDVKEVNLDRRVDIHAENRPVSMHRSKENATLVPEQQTQEHTVKGLVTDVEGEPIIGANIKVEGTSAGTITDLKGRFTLDVPENAVLQISYIGYISQKVKVGGKLNITIRLTEDAQALDEVVVVGYGTMKKSDLTGAVISANLKDFEKAPNTNILQSLQGTCIGRDYIYRIFIVSKP